jgi:hypothetical protein
MSEYSDYIDDGYTEEGKIAAEPGIHGPLTFEYRPMIPSVQGRLMDVRGSSDKFVDLAAKLLCGKDGHLKAWSLVNKKKEAVEINEENLKRVRPSLFDKLWQIVANVRPSDGKDKTVDLAADGKN